MHMTQQPSPNHSASVAAEPPDTLQVPRASADMRHMQRAHSHRCRAPENLDQAHTPGPHTIAQRRLPGEPSAAPNALQELPQSPGFVWLTKRQTRIHDLLALVQEVANAGVARRHAQHAGQEEAQHGGVRRRLQDHAAHAQHDEHRVDGQLGQAVLANGPAGAARGVVGGVHDLKNREEGSRGETAQVAVV